MMASLDAVTLSSAHASNDFTARKVVKEMAPKEQYSYIAGVVEGLAVARYLKDGKAPAGMNCIYGWFYDDKKAIDAIYVAFGQFADYPPGAVIAALAKQKCGD